MFSFVATARNFRRCVNKCWRNGASHAKW